jgi:Flp pilus assembly protein TadD
MNKLLRWSLVIPKLHYLFALTLARHAKTDSAIEQYRQAIALQPEMLEALNNLAWLLATSGESRLRNGSEAVQLAQHACELTQNQQPLFLGTLAAAYAEVGRFDDAIRTAEKARDLAEPMVSRHWPHAMPSFWSLIAPANRFMNSKRQIFLLR